MSNLPSGTGTIIVVDDEFSIRLVLRRILQEIAPTYDIVVAQHGAGAIVQIESRFVPLVITDYQMPDMNGLEIIREIKLRSPNTFVVLLTGLTDDGVKQQSIDAGADYILVKPVSVAQLRDVVILALAKRIDEGYML